MQTDNTLPASESYLQYAADGSFRFIVKPRSDRTICLIVEKRYYEWYYYDDDSDDWYYDFDEPFYFEVYRCFVDTKEHAITLGAELLECYTAKE